MAREDDRRQKRNGDRSVLAVLGVWGRSCRGNDAKAPEVPSPKEKVQRCSQRIFLLFSVRSMFLAWWSPTSLNRKKSMWKDQELKEAASAYGSSLKIREKLNVHVGVSGFVRRIDQHRIKVLLALCQDTSQPCRWAEWWRASGYGSKDFLYRRKDLGRERLHLRAQERVNPSQTLSLVGRCPRQVVPIAFLVFLLIVVQVVDFRTFDGAPAKEKPCYQFLLQAARSTSDLNNLLKVELLFERRLCLTGVRC